MLRFRISNMGCGGCGKGVTAVLRDVDPRAAVTLDLERREVSIESAQPDAERFGRALHAAGWKSEHLPA